MGFNCKVGGRIRMIDEITPESIASEVNLLRSDIHYRGAFLFVEGETDCSLFSNYIDHENCLIRRVIGRENVLRLIQIVLQFDSLCLAIVDADFWHIERKLPPYDNVIMTDTHDIETLIFKSPAFDKILHELISVDKIESIRQRYPDIRYQILNVASGMAIFRYASHSKNLRINFYSDLERTQPVGWDKAIKIDSFKVDFEKLVEIICYDNYSLRFKLRPIIKEIMKKKYDLYEFCNGHDVVYVSMLFFKRKGRHNDVVNLTTKVMERMFRLAYEVEFFKQTAIYKEIVSWQKSKEINILNI